MNVALRSNSSTDSHHTALSRATATHLSRVEIYENLELAQPAWRGLDEAHAQSTPYQRFDWIALWHRHISQPQGATPLIVAGFDDHGSPLFLWPLLRRKSGALVVAEYFGGQHANLNAGLWRRDIAEIMTAADLRAVLTQVAGDHRIDLFMLLGQPSSLGGIANPFLLLPHRDSPDDVYALALGGRSVEDALNHSLSANMRGRLRGKERKLKSIDGYRYLQATRETDVDRILDAFFDQKAAHMANQGIDNAFAPPEIAAFVRAACHEGLAAGHPVIELHALEGGGDVIAVFGVVTDRQRMSCMFNSYTLGDGGRWSPGLVLLTHLIAGCAERRLASFDLGAGYASYKSFFCRTAEQSFDNFLPFSPIGHLAAIGFQSTRTLKRWIKSNPMLLDATQAARRRFLK